MTRVVLSLSAIAAALAVPTIALAQTQAPPQTITLAAQMIRSYQNLQRNLTEAAEKVSDADYSFRPTPEIRPFGQLIAHTALAQFGTCAAIKGDANAGPHEKDEETAPLTKAQLVSLLKESTAYCDPIISAMTDADMTTLVKTNQNQVAKGLFLGGVLTHGNEMYGTMCVYLRLKGIVPPSTERMNANKK